MLVRAFQHRIQVFEPLAYVVLAAAAVMLSGMGLSQSSTSTTTRWPVARWAWAIPARGNCPHGVFLATLMARAVHRHALHAQHLPDALVQLGPALQHAIAIAKTDADNWVLPTASPTRVSAASPLNSAALPSNISFSVSREQAFAKAPGGG